MSTHLSQSRTRARRSGASRVAVVFTAAGIGFFVLAAMWMGTCTGSTVEPVACGAPQRALLAVGAPAILLVGALYAWARSVRARSDHYAWVVTAAWLLALMLLTALPSLP